MGDITLSWRTVSLCNKLFGYLKRKKKTFSQFYFIGYSFPCTDLMSVVGKSTCYIKQRGYFIQDARISGYFETKYMTLLWIEQILHNFEDQKFVIFFNLEQVNFRVTLVICVSIFRSAKCLRGIMPETQVGCETTM